MWMCGVALICGAC